MPIKLCHMASELTKIALVNVDKAKAYNTFLRKSNFLALFMY